MLLNITSYFNNLIKTLGVKSSDYNSNNIWGLTQRNEKHNHAVGKCYPDLANGITVTGGSGAWELGSFVEIVPANTIDDYFDVHWVTAYGASVTDSYQLNLYQGAEGSEKLISSIPLVREATQSGVSPVSSMTPLLNPNTRISAKLASLSGGNDTMKVKIIYHTY